MRKFAERSELVQLLSEVFREHGFAGASLADISQTTGLGKGSLYHVFPGGKDEMAKAVLDDVAGWFEINVFTPLHSGEDPAAGIDHMFQAVIRFFKSGRRVCLVGTFALNDTRDRFAVEVRSYFSQWIRALSSSLRGVGFDAKAARETAEEVVGGIQGALVLARSQQDPAVFMRAMRRLHARTRFAEVDSPHRRVRSQRRASNG